MKYLNIGDNWLGCVYEVDPKSGIENMNAIRKSVVFNCEIVIIQCRSTVGRKHLCLGLVIDNQGVYSLSAIDIKDERSFIGGWSYGQNEVRYGVADEKDISLGNVY